MKPYLSDPDLTVYNGDALETLRELPAESVQMCVTSPPFFGLRDYGTGTWEGGDAGCDHMPELPAEQIFDNGQGDGYASNNQNWNKRGRQFQGDTCGKCGARRVDRQIGLEQTPEDWVASLVAVFEEVRRVLRKDGTLWIEVGDSFAGSWGNQGRKPERGTQRPINGPMLQPLDERYPNKGNNTGAIPAGSNLKPKDLIGQPFLLAFALREAGWYWRNVCIWHKPNPMPESVRDRFTVSHSYVLLFSKSPRYFFDAEAVRESHVRLWNESNVGPDNWVNDPEMRNQKLRSGDSQGGGHYGLGSALPNPAGRNARSVWSISTEPLPFEHYAAFPQALAERCIKAGTSERGCCPECGTPWVRETSEREVTAPPERPTNKPIRYLASAEAGQGQTHLSQSTLGMVGSIETTGWHPSCDHGHEPIPMTVLDCFGGSGTTALVARRLNRKAILVELNEKYCELIARRTQQLSLEAEADLSPAIGMEP